MNETTSRPERRLPVSQGASAWMFVREAVRDPRAVGAIAPSGAALAQLLTEPVRDAAGPVEVMEVGGGTGSVTAAVIPLLTTCCRLDVVEANPRFADRLRLLADSHAECAGRVTVYNTPIERMRTARRYDVIISGLPFANFEPEQVDDIMSRYLELLRPGGVLTYFAYRGAAIARTLFSGRDQARRHRAVNEVMADYRRRYGVGSTTVWANLPPAEVFRLRRPARSITASGSSRMEAGR